MEAASDGEGQESNGEDEEALDDSMPTLCSDSESDSDSDDDIIYEGSDDSDTDSVENIESDTDVENMFDPPAPTLHRCNVCGGSG